MRTAPPPRRVPHHREGPGLGGKPLPVRARHQTRPKGRGLTGCRRRPVPDPHGRRRPSPVALPRRSGLRQMRNGLDVHVLLRELFPVLRNGRKDVSHGALRSAHQFLEHGCDGRFRLARLRNRISRSDVRLNPLPNRQERQRLRRPPLQQSVRLIHQHPAGKFPLRETHRRKRPFRLRLLDR